MKASSSKSSLAGADALADAGAGAGAVVLGWGVGLEKLSRTSGQVSYGQMCRGGGSYRLTRQTPSLRPRRHLLRLLLRKRLLLVPLSLSLWASHRQASLRWLWVLRWFGRERSLRGGLGSPCHVAE
jgi:hypothetical protein